MDVNPDLGVRTFGMGWSSWRRVPKGVSQIRSEDLHLDILVQVAIDHGAVPLRCC